MEIHLTDKSVYLISHDILEKRDPGPWEDPGLYEDPGPYEDRGPYENPGFYEDPRP